MNFKIIRKIFKENKNLDLTTKIYLTQNYISNLNAIRRENNLSVFRKIILIKFNNKNGTNKNISKNNVCKNFPDFSKELPEIKNKLFKQKLIFIKDKLLTIITWLNIKHLIDLKNSQNNIKHLLDFISRHVGVYKNSIQALVEGQREVTQNKNFTFDDGETVQEKMDKFEVKLKEHLNIKEIFSKNKNKFI
jgi:hypothetical protein